MKFTVLMTKTILLTLVIAGVFIVGSFASNEAFAAVDMFMKIGGVDGESTDKDHKDWINLLSVSWSVNAPATSSGQRTGPPSISGMTIKNVLDKSTPKLFEAAITGQHQDVKIDFCKSSDKDCYLRYELKNAIITSYSVGGSSGEDILTEQITLNFEEIKVTYTKQDKGKSTGETVEYSWRVTEGAS